MTSMARIQLPAAAAARSAAPADDGVRATIRPAAEAVAALAAEWTALAASASEPNPFAEHWFFAASLPTLAAGCDVRMVEVRRSGRLIGLLAVETARGYARTPIRFVRNWRHHHSLLGTPLVAAGEERAFWRAAIAALDDAPWAPNLLHLRGLAEGGPVERAIGGAIVHRYQRALLRSDLSPEAYYAQAVRPKKRKELRRLRNRLAELGPLEARLLDDGGALPAWCDAFLALERAGWKGREGTALACATDSEAFFRAALAAAWEAGRLQFRRLDLAGRPIAMLVNFICPPGAFAFKTAFDESFGHFSPGVLLQIENLDILDRGDIAWSDSCAMPDHPMIDSLWTERRAIVRVTVRLKGWRHALVWAFCRALERIALAARGKRL